MKHSALYLMCLLYVVAGINHFANPNWYLKIIPAWVPYPVVVNYMSGAFEIAFALLLIPEATRNMGVYLLIILLVLIFPANIQMSFNFYQTHHPYFWLTILRLPFQFVLIWWAWQYVKT